MVGSELTGPRIAQLVVMPVLVVVIPWFARNPHTPAPRIRPWVLLTVGLSLVALSSGPRLGRVDVAFSREPVFHALVSMLAPATQADPGDLHASVPPRARGPARLTPRADVRHPSLVIVMLESTRASATTPYNPGLPTTPFMAALAQTSEVVQRAYAVIPHTSKALISVLCGIEPRLSFDVVEATPGAMPGRCLADLLAEQGYDTAYFQAATKKFEQRVGLVGNMGFDKVVGGDDIDHAGFEKANYFGFEDDILLAPTRQWLADRSDAPFFAAYLTNTPHHDYRTPSRYGRPKLAGQSRLNKYLQAVRYQDFFLKNLFDAYKQAGRYDDTVFILVGDHGQGFGEHGMWIHDDIMYDEGLQVPLLLHWPAGGVKPRLVAQTVSHLDIAPTALDVLGFDSAEGGYSGSSWRSDTSVREVRAACYRNLQCLAGVRGDRKLIHYFGKQDDELFDLTADPQERDNLAAAHPQETLSWAAELLAWKRAVHEMHRPFGESRLRQFVRGKSFRPQTPLSVRFGEAIELVGVDMPRAPVRPGRRFAVALHFKASGTPGRGHIELLMSAGGGRKSGTGHVPALGLHPLGEWRSGEFIRDVLNPRTSPAFKADHLHLCVRLVGEDGRPMAVAVSEAPGPVQEGCVRVATLAVKSGSAR